MFLGRRDSIDAVYHLITATEDWQARVFGECEFFRCSAGTLLCVAGVRDCGAQHGRGVAGDRFGVAAADDLGFQVGEPLE
jgi:hypothetical protein